MSIILSASTNPPKTEEEMYSYIAKLDKSEVDFIHCDVMDGKFVENKTYNHKDVKIINTITNKKLDVHLMVKNPTFKIPKYIHAGADVLTIHFESYKNKKKLIKDLQKIRRLGAFAGLSFNPDTQVVEILPFVSYCDMLLVMSVVPGKSGQKFMEETYARLCTINSYLASEGLEVAIEVDGGVNLQNLPKLIECSVTSVVMGNYLYTTKDLNKTIKQIKAVK